MDLVKRIMIPPNAYGSASATDSDGDTNSQGSSIKKKGKVAKKTGGGNEEVQMLRKEIEEMKFYQELEQTEYQEMKQKMHKYEKQVNEMAKQKSKPSTSKKLAKVEEESEVLSGIDTVDMMAISPSESNVNAPSSSKIKKKDNQIKQLKSKLNEKVATAKESSGKLKNMAKEYEKRFNKMESMKDEEVEEIKVR